MSSSKKLLQSASGYINQSGGGLSGDGLFKVHIHEGDGADPRSMNVGIDLDTEGGLVWIKSRDSAYNHLLSDTERGANKNIYANAETAEQSTTNAIKSFTSTGWTMGDRWQLNENNKHYVSWTFRKAEKFFDIQTWTGDGTNNRAIAHNLNHAVGAIFIKVTSGVTDHWIVYHRSLGYQKLLRLNLTGAAWTQSRFGNQNATSSYFYVDNNNECNTSGYTYVAYLFAHNDGDATFGDGTQDFIKCGTYTGGSVPSNSIYKIDLGFEPQWVLIKRTDATGNWTMWDTTRGMPSTEGARASGAVSWSNYNGSEELFANTSAAVSGFGGQQYGTIHPYAEGFGSSSNNTAYNQQAVPSIPQVAGEYVYIAIRKTPMTAPTTSSEVFDVKTYTGSSNFTSLSGLGMDVVDMTTNFIRGGSGAGTLLWTRLGGHGGLETDSTNKMGNTTDTLQFEFNNKITITGGNTGSNGSTYVQHLWRRAPKFFDVVSYLGNATARTIQHNLQASPELIIFKTLSHDSSQGWETWWAENNTQPYSLFLNQNYGQGYSSHAVNTATATSFNIPSGNADVNSNGKGYIALLFATLSGISKVGTFTHPTGAGGSGQSQIDCGFSAGSKYILLKRYSGSGDWYVFDSVRGYGSGNDPYHKYNTDDAEVTNSNVLAAYSAGFQATSNIPSGDYIFYAISA